MSGISLRTRGLRILACSTVVLATFGPQAVNAGGSNLSVVSKTAARGWGAPLPTNGLIIKYRDGTDGVAVTSSESAKATLHRQAQDVIARAGERLTFRKVGVNQIHVMRLNRFHAHDEVARLAREIAAADPRIEYVEPDAWRRAMFVPNDPQYDQQWHYHEAAGGLNLPAAWDKATGTGVVVAVIDSGYRPHADLGSNIASGYDFISDTEIADDGNGRDSDAKDPGDWINAGECGVDEFGDPSPPEDIESSWHGTHVAGTIAALTNNGVGIAGVAHGAKVQPLRVLGKCGGLTSDIAAAITWASGGSVSGVPSNATPAKVINVSLGGYGLCSNTEQSAITGARDRGTTVVVAAGNDGINASYISPANCDGTVVVAAVNRSGGRAFYSNYGSLVTVAAPGGDMRRGIDIEGNPANGILSTLNSGTRGPSSDSYRAYQGTSMAAPHVAGVVALMLSKNPSLTPDQVSERLKSSARAFPKTCSQCGAGIVDASAAIDAAGEDGGEPPPPPPPPTGNEVEPNNSRSQAQSVATGATVSGTMSSSSDDDYFKVQVPANGRVAVKLTPNDSSDYDLYAYDSSGTQIGKSERGEGEVDTITLRNRNSGAATAYFRVMHYSGPTGKKGTYSLKFE